MPKTNLQAFILLPWLTFIHLATSQDPFCNLAYGSPNYNDCRDLALELWDGWPGDIPDRREHLFSVDGALIPEWAPVGSRNNREFVPRTATKGQSLA